MRFFTKVVLTAVILMVAVICQPLDVRAEVPHLINYQGKLTDSDGKALEGSYDVTFRMYDAESAGELLWEETQRIVIDRGVFSVLLGSAEDLNIPFDKPYFLELKVGSEVMSPRQRLASVGYALRAEVADLAKNAELAENAQITEKIKASSSDASPGYLDDKVDNATVEVKNNIIQIKDKGIGQAQISRAFGAWETKSKDTVYLASSDGLVCVIGEDGKYKLIEGFTDSSDTPTTKRVSEYTGATDDEHGSFTMPVRKGDYWKVTGNAVNIYWISLGR